MHPDGDRRDGDPLGRGQPRRRDPEVAGRTWVDPCYYGQQLGAGLAGGTPVGVDLTCSTFSTGTSFGSDTTDPFGRLDPVTDAPAVDATAVTDAAAGGVVVMPVHRDAGADAVDVTVEAGE